MFEGKLVSPFRGFRQGLREIFLNPHLQTICIWKVLVPFLFIIVIYPIFVFVANDVNHPFERAFAHGELLVFSALILIEAAVELRRAKIGYDEVLRALSLLPIMFYGFIKYKTMLQEPKMEHEDIAAIKQLFLFSFFNCAVAVFAVTGSIYSFLQAVRSENGKAERLLEHPDEAV
jgi:hypothetical protein